MKKTIVFIIILAIIAALIPEALAADESAFYGAWGRVYSTNAGGAVFEVFYITQDQKVFYVYETFSADQQTSRTEYVGAWSPTANGIHIVYGKNQDGYVKLLNDNYISLKMGIMEYAYGRIPAGYSAATGDMPIIQGNPFIPQGSLESGVVILPGEYVSGGLIPKGDYIVQADKKTEIKVSVNHAAYYASSDYVIGGAKNPQSVVVHLETGAMLIIKGGSVTLSQFQGYGF